MKNPKLSSFFVYIKKKRENNPKSDFSMWWKKEISIFLEPKKKKKIKIEQKKNSLVWKMHFS